VDLYSYAWASDPIAAGFIPESGNAFSWGLPYSATAAAEAWYNTSQTLGCGGATSDSATVLSCMRTKNYTSILSSIPTASGTAGILGYFVPSVDEKVVFSNYSTRTPANVPMLIGNNNYEAGLFRTQLALAGLLYSDTFWDDFNLQEFTCPAGIRANASVAANIPVWRYRYFGIFPDTTISSEAGAWHAAEIPLLFNTNIAYPPATEAEVEIGNYMRGAWAAFAKDPQKGLTTYGWPAYNVSQDSLVRLAYNNLTGPNLINPRRYDADCVFVNTSSTDAGFSPKLPDLGASITPTGTSSYVATRTGAAASSTTTGAGRTTPTSTTQSAATRVGFGFNIWVGVAALLVAYLI
jgi:cholinesterase